jgi:F0F1-type ATP synthase assembly protein I
MLKIILIAVAVILVTIGLVWLIDKFIPSKMKPVLTIVLWVLIFFLGYQTFMSIYEPIQFNKEKNKRYKAVIENLIDIRDAQLAHQQVTGQFAPNFDNLEKFLDTAKFTITQRRDTTVIDVELTKRYGGVETLKDSIIIDTLGFVSVKDSLFKNSDRYKTMMNVPNTDAQYEMQAGILEDNDLKIPVFEASVKKNVILFDQNKDLIAQENQVISVDGVNGDALRVGSMSEVKTNGNWPITYGESE